VTWFWIWLGGSVAHALFLFANALLLDQFRHCVHKRMWGQVVGLLLTIPLWPVGVVALLIPKRVLKKWLDRLEPDSSSYVDVVCPVCGFKGEVAIWDDVEGHTWDKIPIGWWMSCQEEIACSKKCADDFAVHKARREDPRFLELH